MRPVETKFDGSQEQRTRRNPPGSTTAELPLPLRAPRFGLWPARFLLRTALITNLAQRGRDDMPQQTDALRQADSACMRPGAARKSRRACRPRWIRLRTVPSLTPSVAPISS